MNSDLSIILQLRVLVGFLGERSQYDWWPTNFFGNYSLRSLEFMAPKTAALAQYHGAVEAARRLHDEHLSVGSYHLFRLPEEVEQNLYALLQSAQGAEDVGALPVNKESAMAGLFKLADTDAAAAEGPVCLGSINALSATATAKSIAGFYWHALSGGIKAYPYLVR